MIKLKRIYEEPARGDGFRVLVDRLWPRGVSKEEARVDLWLKEVSPSDSLRQWFNHDPAKWADFQKKYKAELKNNPAVKDLRGTIAKHPTVTLVFAAKDVDHNNAVALKNWLDKVI